MSVAIFYLFFVLTKMGQDNHHEKQLQCTVFICNFLAENLYAIFVCFSEIIKYYGPQFRPHQYHSCRSTQF